jgi:predicted DsbA family dithiol-disulfide isomerase
MIKPTSAYTSFTLAAVKLSVFLGLGLSIGAITIPVGAQTEERVVAVVNGRRVTQREVDASLISQLLPLQQQIHALRKAALQNLIITVILEDEAKKKGIPVEELRRQLTAGKIEVTPTQVEQLYLENASVLAAMSPDEARERLRLDLESQARMRNYREALSKLKEKAAVEILLEEPKLLPIGDGNAGHAVGAKEAAVVITEFSDFQCPYCKQSQGALKQVLQAYGNEVRLVFRHLPLDIHRNAFASAQAAVCAAQQDSFWQYHDALFTSEDLSPAVLDRIATTLRLNERKFKACIESEASRAAVLKDIQEAQRLGIKGTPAFIINGSVYRGALSFEEFKAAIERELKSTRTVTRKE